MLKNKKINLSNSKLTQEKVQQRLNEIKATDELENIKQEMMASSPQDASSASTGVAPVDDLRSVGIESEKIYLTLLSDYHQLLNSIGDYAFAPELRKFYFRDNKINTFLSILHKSGLVLQVRNMMDIFKDRVKQRNGGSLPTIKEKAGLFSKTVTRPMKLEEIASNYDIEEVLPPGVERPLTICGTQEGLLNYLRNILLDDEDVRDLAKRNPRKTVAQFLKAAGLINFQTINPDEKCLIACLITPESLQPRPNSNRESLMKFRSIIKKGKKWLEERIETIKKNQI